MARKVFISFLGTNNYLETIYQFSDNTMSFPTRFIQEAIVAKLCTDWSEEDQALIFCTEDSEKKNWYDDGHPQAIIDVEKKGLASKLEGLHLKINVQMIRIPEGFTTDEIWKIFDIVYDKLHRSDIVYFDVTHAFRSIPFFSTALFNYSRLMKDVEIASIQYGAFEKLGPAFKVKDMPVEQRIAPVLDLTNIARLHQYSDMANSLTSFGRVNQISDTLKNFSEENVFIAQMQRWIETFDHYIVLNRMSEIKEGKWLININQAIKKVRSSNLPQPIKTVINRFAEELRSFCPYPSNSNIEAAVEWAKKYAMIPNAYTMGQEYIISLLVDRFANENPYVKEEALSKREIKIQFRSFLSKVCGIADDKPYKDDLKKYSDLTDKLLQDEAVRFIRPHYQEISRCRNIVNHAKSSEITYDELVEVFDDHYYPCINKLKDVD